MSFATLEQECHHSRVSDKQAIADAFSKAARTYDQHAAFQREVGQRLMDKLPNDLSGLSVLDLGCGTGYFTEQLLKRGADVTAFDLSYSMLEQCQQRCDGVMAQSDNVSRVSYQQGDAEDPPFSAASFDIIFSSLAIQWCHDLSHLFQMLSRMLKKEGQCYFSTLLEGSLIELKRSWSQIDKYQHVNQFHQWDQLNFALAQTSAQRYHVDSAEIQVWYDSAFELMKDLKGIGATHVDGRSAGLTKRRSLLDVEKAYQQFRNPLGQLPATYHVCLGLILK
ncbi:malonyl-ACP O-methyltransferase BioC [Vibrio sp. S11_S32]|uniref:malonyl-ACP O-methyltransferase BioC n=1 Tax=Vibrio sp. S11_S32 TaxID=2720225 RepID=UPI001680675A|nr:malonyl-ACP O-methyltransferase BioC [Vibrio sp. S11_S32]MBD1575439.1 malonyl-ACP O-methyltransferase BioC [Vibrio sp. S11_S32]